MNVNTGAVHPSLATALQAGESLEQLVTGPEPAIHRLSRLVVASNRAAERRRARRLMAKASRKRNRR